MIYIHFERSDVCIAILLKPHMALHRLTGPLKKWRSYFLGNPSRTTVLHFGSALGMRGYKYRYE